jgi:nucleotide-binding universal stress UspA family protein
VRREARRNDAGFCGGFFRNRKRVTGFSQPCRHAGLIRGHVDFQSYPLRLQVRCPSLIYTARHETSRGGDEKSSPLHWCKDRIVFSNEEVVMNANGRILVPVDFSENSANGLKYAVSLAQKTQAEIIVLHVMQKDEADSFQDLLAMMEGVPMAHSRAAIPVDRLLQEKALDLYNFIEKTVRNPGPLKIIRKIAMGNKADRILRAAAEENADLVVLAVQKQSFFRYLMARGKLLNVISGMPCPVLLTPSLDESWPGFGVVGSSLFAR